MTDAERERLEELQIDQERGEEDRAMQRYLGWPPQMLRRRIRIGAQTQGARGMERYTGRVEDCDGWPITVGCRVKLAGRHGSGLYQRPLGRVTGIFLVDPADTQVRVAVQLFRKGFTRYYRPGELSIVAKDAEPDQNERAHEALEHRARDLSQVMRRTRRVQSPTGRDRRRSR